MEINTKYEMGQKVYRARVIKRTFDIEETCDLCCGEKKINYKGYSCMCPKCDGEGKIITGQKTKLSREIQRPREITSVKVSFSITALLLCPKIFKTKSTKIFYSNRRYSLISYESMRRAYYSLAYVANK